MVNKTKNAFTLAEVLITLVIIGIVAALTIPTAINKFRERATIEKIKSSYAILSSAYRLAQMENGKKYSEWNCDGFYNYSNMSKQSNCMTHYIKKHLNRVKDCKFGIDSNVMAKCFNVDDTRVYYIVGDYFVDFSAGGGADMFILSNGVPVYIRAGEHFIFIKTDNAKKLVLNKNLFFFYFFDDEGLAPYNMYIAPMDKEKIRRGRQEGAWALSAVRWIIQNNNMDYLH